MKLSDFNYNLPDELIATHPVEPRDSAKMLVLDRKTEKLIDSYFYDLPKFLSKNDVLVLNNSKVLPARLFAAEVSHCEERSDTAFSFCYSERSEESRSFGKPQDDSKRTFEVLLVKQIRENSWETRVRPGRKAKIASKFRFSESLTAKLIKREEEIFIFEFNLSGLALFKEIERIGEMPIPPYILKARKKFNSDRMKGAEESLKPYKSEGSLGKLMDDREVDTVDYQTVFAEKEGSVAAPTAGLHFTEELLTKLTEKGVQIEYITLHVSLGTFQPVNTDEVEDFKIHSEYFEIIPETAERLNKAKLAGKRIIAVGTTAVRVLESVAVEVKICSVESNYSSSAAERNREVCSPQGRTVKIFPKSGETQIYIYPGYGYKFVDALITNFHLPKSSLLLLVSAFASKEMIDKAYDHAIKSQYRFYSYGDGMLIL